MRSSTNASRLFQVIAASVTTAGALLLTTSTQAQLIAYEGFNYPALSQDQGVLMDGGLGNPTNLVVGAGDAFGWGGAWSTSAGTNQYMSSGLSYNNGATLLTDGGALRVGVVHGSGQAPGTTAQLQRQLGFLGNGGTSNTLGSIAANYGGTIWMSFLYQNWVNDGLPFGTGATNSVGSAYLAFMTGATVSADGSSGRNGTDLFGVGVGNNAAAGVPNGLVMGAIGANTGLTSIDATPTFGPTSAAYLFLLKLQVDNTSAADTISLWENPVLGGEGPVGAPTATFSTNLSSVDGIRFQAGNNNSTRTNAVMVVDEIGLGATYYDLVPTPEPSSIALASAALGLRLAVRRKRA